MMMMLASDGAEKMADRTTAVRMQFYAIEIAR